MSSGKTGETQDFDAANVIRKNKFLPSQELVTHSSNRIVALAVIWKYIWCI